LIATNQLTGAGIEDCELYGEFSLGGEIRALRGMLPAANAATERKGRLILPRLNLEEAQLVQGARIAPVGHLMEVASHLRGLEPLHFVTGATRLSGLQTVSARASATKLSTKVSIRFGHEVQALR
jgi:predicted ATPase with chaperone activity